MESVSGARLFKRLVSVLEFYVRFAHCVYPRTKSWDIYAITFSLGYIYPRDNSGAGSK